jgi:hypothetical protein
VDALSYLIVAEISPHTGAMNRTQLIPEYTITIFSLGNQRLASGNLTVAPHKSFAIQPQIPTDMVNLGLGNIGAAIPFAALTAILAGKQISRSNRIRGHGGSPWLFSE